MSLSRLPESTLAANQEFLPSLAAIASSSQTSLWRSRIAFALALLFLLVNARPVSAHAVLVDSFPAANSTITSLPGEIHLSFSEPLEPAFARVTLFDSLGNAIPLRASYMDWENGNTLVQPVNREADDLYTVRWSVVSAADGHQSEGSFSFVLGSSAASASPVFAIADSTPQVDAVAALIRWGHIVSLALLAGIVVFMLIFGRIQSAVYFAYRIDWFVFASWALYGITLIAMLVLQVIDMRSASTEAVLSVYLRDLLLATRFGALWIARMFVWMLLGVLLSAWTQRSKVRGWISVLLACVLLLLQSAQSHASATGLPLAAVTSNFLHLALASLWIGGLFCVLVALLAIPQGTGLRSTLVTPYTNYARLLVAGLFVTGFYAAWLHAGSWNALVSTLYGAVLLAKLALMIPLLAIGAYNWWLTRTAHSEDEERFQDRLRPMLAAELFLLLGVFAATGILTTTMPSRQEMALQIPTEAAQTGISPATTTRAQLIATEAQQDDLHLHLAVSPGAVGDNQFAVTLHSVATHLPVVTATRIRLQFTHVEMPAGENELLITEGVNGTYTGNGPNLSMPGEWHVRATVHRHEALDVATDFVLQIEAPATTTPVTAPVATLRTEPHDVAHFVAAMCTALILIAIGIVVLARASVRLRSGEGGVALLLLLCGTLIFAFATLG